MLVSKSQMVTGLQHMEGDPLPSCSQLLLGFHRQTPAGVSPHVVEENSLSGKPKILGIAPDLGHVASRVTPEQERSSSAPQGLGFFRNRPRQFMILLSRQERKVWEEPLTPAEDRQASWQSFPAHIPGQREADGQAFRALVGGISGPLAEGTDLAAFPSAWTISVVLLLLMGFLRRLCQSKEKQLVPAAPCFQQLERPP